MLFSLSPRNLELNFAKRLPMVRFDFTQSYARHCYLELSLPPGPNSTYSISPNHLHIWPRGEFMLIALANLVSLSQGCPGTPLTQGNRTNRSP